MNKILNIFIIILFIACQGMPSKKTPIHLNPNMDNQERFDAQEKQYFYDDTSIKKRNPVEGTIAQGYLKDDNPQFYYGTINGPSDSIYVKKVSDIISVDEKLIKRGQERFNIYCSVCHGYKGDGKGLVPKKDKYNLIPRSLYDETLDDKNDGYFFHVITNGKNNNNMPSYAHQIIPEDR